MADEIIKLEDHEQAMQRIINIHPKFVSEEEDQTITWEQCRVLLMTGQLLTWKVMEKLRVETEAEKVKLMEIDNCESYETLVKYCGLCGNWA